MLLPLADDADWGIRNEAARGLGRLAKPRDAATCCSPWRATWSRWSPPRRGRRSTGLQPEAVRISA